MGQDARIPHAHLGLKIAQIQAFAEAIAKGAEEHIAIKERE